MVSPKLARQHNHHGPRNLALRLLHSN